MSTTLSEQIQKNIKFNLARLREADKEIANIAALRCRLWRDTLDSVQQYVDARLAEDKAQAVTVEQAVSEVWE